MFPNPSRQPVVVEVDNTGTAIQMVVEEKVAAAIIPTPVVSQRMAQGAPINVVSTTEPIPHIALSASPDIDAATRAKIQHALLSAADSPAGKQMLQAIGFPRFDPATPATYAGQDRILKEYWGY
jgi:ABC-type phosphate/phosphonate transport system substrate-binding protein